MDSNELKNLRPRLGQFLRHFNGGIKTSASREHFRRYVRGQLSDLERKSIAPIALQAGVAPLSLQEFVEIHRWQPDEVRARLQGIVMQEHADPNAMGIIDETSYAKKGDKTAGVQRQYCGAMGKKENCVVTVHLGYVTDEFHALVDSDLYLPEQTWAANRQ
jgi:SRSO17 transposase